MGFGKSGGKSAATKDTGLCLGMFDPNVYGFGPKIRPRLCDHGVYTYLGKSKRYLGREIMPVLGFYGKKPYNSG
jgi:hypothetical protein